MAVLQPGAYNGIYDMLKQRADQAAAMPPDTLGVAAKAVGTAAGAYVGDKIHTGNEEDLLKFKSNLENGIHQNEAKYKAAGEGKVFRTQKDFNDHYVQMGIDPKYAPQIGDTGVTNDKGEMGIYTAPGDELNAMKHAQFQTELQKQADELSKSTDKADQHRGSLLRLISNIPQDKLSDEKTLETIRKTIVPESEKAAKASLTKYTNPDTGEVMQKNNDTGEEIALSGPKNRPPEGTLVTKTDQLYAKEKTAIEKAKATTQKQVKPVTDTIDTADSLNTDLQKNNPNTLLNIRGEVAKLVGIPPSRLGFNMLQQEGLNKGVAERIVQGLTQADGGQALSPGNQKALLDYVNSKKQEKIKQLKSVFSDNADGLSLPQVHPDLLNSELTKGYGRYLGFPVIGPVGPDGKPQTGSVPKKGQKLPAGWTYAE